MATFTSVKQYREANRKRLAAMRKAGLKSSSQATGFMLRQAKGMAPYSSGETFQGIKKRKRKGKWAVISEVPGAFKQNLFSNQTAPYRTVNYGPKGGSVYYAPDQTVVYGQSASSRSGRQIRWTGTPRWFHFATLRTRKFFPKLAVQNNRKALKVTT